VRSLWLTADVIFQPKRKEVQTIKLNENVVDEIKKAMKSYLARLAERALSRRQAILVQTINRCMADVERIGDHIDEVCDISIRRKRAPLARFNRETLAVLMDLHEGAAKVLHLVIESLNPESADFQAMAQAILQARDEYTEKSINAKAFFTEKIANHEYPPIAGVYFSEYVAAFDRIVKHSKSIALAEKQPFFWIKRKKLEQMVTEAPHYQPVTLSDPKDFLDKLHQENYL
jgi:phosphate:Na+ symporter